ncbi:hypothetical protein LEP1GSC021_3463 [Leptospira noguchii str. 1993005606]|uniref:Uncharacterized protein n=1 Tax=Leptospira noguchii str. 2007001578 TaxID=1049974 RepID=A0ABN0J4Q9_9LEPT|nr:hypothetical protein LEP1GSC035_4264 [Leptospira noguchii str. 2007001578]EPE84657.1 hypothetical protein LEP1GSC021_3463 [Leptospira noguchii str. 1993005606]
MTRAESPVRLPQAVEFALIFFHKLTFKLAWVRGGIYDSEKSWNLNFAD